MQPCINEGKIRDFHFYGLTNGDPYLHSKTSTMLTMCQKQSIFARESQKIVMRYIPG